jgi:two-component system response regulator RstA
LDDNRPTVLIADDNDKMVEVICRLLATDYQLAKVVSDGAAALNYVLGSEPDFAILDISMPEMDGICVARGIQQARRRTCVVFVTTIEDKDCVREARLVGHGYVLKRRLSLDLLDAVRGARDGDFFRSDQSDLR